MTTEMSNFINIANKFSADNSLNWDLCDEAKIAIRLYKFNLTQPLDIELLKSDKATRNHDVSKFAFEYDDFTGKLKDPHFVPRSYECQE